MTVQKKTGLTTEILCQELVLQCVAVECFPWCNLEVAVSRSWFVFAMQERWTEVAAHVTRPALNVCSSPLPHAAVKEQKKHQFLVHFNLQKVTVAEVLTAFPFIFFF